jgi:carbonic anhydrase
VMTSARRWSVTGAIVMAAAVTWTASSARATATATAAAESLSRLKAGNAEFVSHPEAALPVDAARRAALAQGQTPFATVLSCADSRVPPEIVFHTGLGDLFVVRAAGNIADKAILASVEYGAEHLHVPLVVVMGHESCGAVKAAVETPVNRSLGPNLDFLIKAIRPAVLATASLPEATRMRAAILHNVEDSVNALIDASAILRHLGEGGKVGFVGAYYELSTGRVHFSAPASIAARAR